MNVESMHNFETFSAPLFDLTTGYMFIVTSWCWLSSLCPANNVTFKENWKQFWGKEFDLKREKSLLKIQQI